MKTTSMVVVVVVVAMLSFVVAVLMTLGISAAVNNHNDNQPHCPTEDSCTVQYENGEWVIEEDTP